MSKKLTLDEFIERGNKVHNNEYDYSNSEYVNYNAPIKIICHKHGEFTTTPHIHLSGCKCPQCTNEIKNKKLLKSFDEFVKEANKIHNNAYEYLPPYLGSYKPIGIICTKHGIFYQVPHNHLKGHGCPKCGKCYMDKEYFIENAIMKHGNKYDYSKIEYINSNKKVYIICPKHGEFWQSPNNHLNGAGCPKCNMSHLEQDVMLFLERHNVEYEYQKRFEWLGKQSLDFYLPNYRIAVECQGRQHFESVEYFGGEDEYKKIQKRDAEKRELCEEHNIILRYYNEKTY